MPDLAALKAEALAALKKAYKKNKQGHVYHSRRITRTTPKNKKGGPGEIMLTLVWRTPVGIKQQEELVAIPSNQWEDFDENAALAAGHNIRIENAKGEIVFEAHRGHVSFPADVDAFWRERGR